MSELFEKKKWKTIKLNSERKKKELKKKKPKKGIKSVMAPPQNYKQSWI